ncbi:hypothetical protein GX50_09022 [[Emmonsia] crescens]|uniref:Uncharacterized protein n=1 Tax=[Emmonsia] crescens TaxID=73230 RepID=A0A2B7XYJ1_9EURO|nr:hypothetical protein GX50_09022 [Emmonsia crescens]
MSVTVLQNMLSVNENIYNQIYQSLEKEIIHQQLMNVQLSQRINECLKALAQKCVYNF